MKKKLVLNLCLLIVLALCFGDLIPIIECVDLTAFAAGGAEEGQGVSIEQDEGVVRPEDIDEGLSLNGLEDIRGRRVTVRQPVMEILDDNIVRKPADVMSDVYEMLDFKTGEIMDPLAKINFASDPVLEAGNKDHPMYPMRGLERSPKDSDGNVTGQKYFSEFKKYMLLRQAYYFNTHVMDIIKDGKLKKHPAADYIYGKIPDDAKAVKMRIVTDPIYRSPMTTGLYLAPGEIVTVKIKGLKAGETVSLYTHHQDTMGYLGYKEDGGGFGRMEDYLDYWDQKIVGEAKRAAKEGSAPNFEKFKYGLHGQWQWQNQKVPCMGTTFNIVGTGQETEIKIGSMYGGPLYVKPTTDVVEMEITGAVLTPHFVLGVTTVEDFDEQLRKAPGLIATLDVENGQLIGPAEDMRKCDDIEKLAYFWHSVFAIDISLNGRAYNYNMTMCYDVHVPAGEAVALNSNFCAQPEYWFPICMNYETLTTKGNWGTFHELGHVQAKTHGVNWGFCDGDGEVWNNTLILLIYSMLCNMDSRVISVEHGEYVHPYTAVERSQKITKEYTDKATGQTHRIDDYGKINEGGGAHFDQLSMYATLLHSFGPDKFVDMFYTYKMDPAYCDNKRADFVYRIGVVDRVNILDWVNENYFANISDDMFDAGQLEFLRNLPKFVPVAYYWANGIDGNETARKYDVDGKFPTVFDLGGKNISSPESVEILDVSGARYGRINYDREAQKVTYTPPEKATEYDRFDIIVKTNGGRRVTLNVNMRLVYRGMYGEVWDMGTKSEWGGKNPSISQVKERIGNKEHDYTLTSPSAGVEFNHQNIEYLHLRLKYRVPQNGSYGFYVKADDIADVNFFKSNINGEHLGKVSVTHDTTSFTTYPNIETALTAGDTVFIDCELVNWGGKGHITVGVRTPDTEEVVALPADRILSAGVEDDELTTVDSFKGWQPRFTDSIKNATIDYQVSNSGWDVLYATTAQGDQTVNQGYLVDGNENTAFHSKYQGGRIAPPHVFIIDTKEDQTFNYFEVVRRTNGNDKLLKYALYSCTGEEYDKLKDRNVNDNTGWTELFDGASSNINAARQRISFALTQIRYFKFVVNDNGSQGGTRDGNTVIKEVYAGIESQLSQTVKPSNYMKENKGFEENSANGKLSATTAGAKFEFEFLGSGFELFADTDPDYGRASVIVDGIRQQDIDLSDKPLFNKRVFDFEEEETGVHTVVVTTLDAKPFNISFINVKYGTPVAAEEYPATEKDGKPDYGDTNIQRQFTREWKTVVKDYKTLTSIKFVEKAPDGYKDTFVRIDTYIRLYRDGDKIAFVYPGTILAPIECASLFSGCEALTELVLDNFDTTYMRGAMSMFFGCGALRTLDLSKFTTQNVLSFGKMFGNCTSLENIDLSNFKLDENANIYRMFENCAELESITLPKQVEVKRSRSAEDKLTCDLPYVYLDKNTGKYTYKLEIGASTAGHVLELHENHTWDNSKIYKQQEATCEENGVIAYKTCSTCNCNFDVETGHTLLKDADLVIPALGHDYEYDWPEDPSAYPTCTKPGLGGSFKCKHCNDIKEDIGQTSAIGHSYLVDRTQGDGNGYEIEYGDDGKATVKIYLICDGLKNYETGEKCEHKTQIIFAFDPNAHQEATCTEEELYYYDFTIERAMLESEILLQDDEDEIGDGLNENFRMSVRETVECASAKGHTLEKVDAVPATCTAYGSTEGLRCSECGYTEGVKATNPLNHNMAYSPALAATCTDEGHGAGLVCSRCGETGEGVEHYAPLGHDFSVVIDEELPTCTHVGHTAGKKCSRCEAIEGYDIVDDLGHDVEIIEGKAPTEKESGLTEGKRCARCGEILQAQEEIPPLGRGNATLIWALAGTGAALGVAGAVVAVVFAVKRKRKKIY